MSWGSEFKAFIQRGNVVDMAVAVVLGLAFGRVVTAFVDGILMPPLGLLMGGTDFANLFVALDGSSHASLAAARAAGAPVLAYGAFLNTVVEFLLIALGVFLIVKAINRLYAGPGKATCPYCATEISAAATRCPACTSSLTAEQTVTIAPESGARVER